MLFKLSLCIVLLPSIQLFAYQKRVLIASFSIEKNAERAFELIDKRLGNHPEIVLLEKKGITFYKKRSGKYHIITLEPFHNQQDLQKGLRVVKKEYKNAYFVDMPSKKLELKTSLETDISLNLPQKESLLFKELNKNITTTFNQVDHQTEVKSINTSKIELLSQTSMENYLHEMSKYKKELEETKEKIDTSFYGQKKEKPLKLNITDFLIAIVILMLLFYALKFTLKK